MLLNHQEMLYQTMVDADFFREIPLNILQTVMEFIISISCIGNVIANLFKWSRVVHFATKLSKVFYIFEFFFIHFDRCSWKSELLNIFNFLGCWFGLNADCQSKCFNGKWKPVGDLLCFLNWIWNKCHIIGNE